MKHSPTPAANGTDVANRQDAVTADGRGHGGYSALVAEVEGLKSLLRDAFVRANQLVLALKKHRKQAQAVQATLSSLRQLQHVEG